MSSTPKETADQHLRWATSGSEGPSRIVNANIATAINLGRIADALERIVAEEFDDTLPPEAFDVPEAGR